VTNGARADGLQALAGLVDEVACALPQSRLTPVLSRLRRPVRVAVDGRSGVGRCTVATVLHRRGVTVASTGERADLRVVVIAEALKPEDRAMLETDVETVIVLNKADLSGSAAGGAMANAVRRAVEVRALTGVPTVPMVGLLAEAAVDDELDGELVDALRTMVTAPADLTSVDAFASVEHPVDRGVRERLLERLDRFGVAHAVVALARGADPAHLPKLFDDVSNVAAVLAQLRQAAAPIRYRRVRAALAELSSLTVEFDDPRLTGLLSSDPVVLATMTAAVEVVEADGLTVDARDGANAHMRRATRWQRYGEGPVNALHRQCSADIVRGSLRLLDGPP